MRYIGLGKLAHVFATWPSHTFSSVPENYMTNSNSSSTSAPSRVTLKLKGPARKSSDESKAPPILRTQSKPNLKPGAQWSDEYKKRMQADMDELAS
jgi:hypothetical protein